jgi:predicted membrane protein DUF2339
LNGFHRAPKLMPMPSDGDRPSLESRVSTLEREVRQLRAELLRTKSANDPSLAGIPEPVFAAVEAPAPVSRPGSDAPLPPAKPAFHLDLETLVGRYGMLGLATLLALAAIGTFVSWAAARGLFGPTTRVILGFVAALGIAATGLLLRPRSRSFSDSLLALALAAIHVCAWAAGPSLGLVPAPLALAFSAAASVALGAFALVQADELLWCVGFGGACVAPFVTSTGQGTAPMLAAYGCAALIAAGSGLASRRWFIAGRIFAAGAALFVVALLTMPAAQNAPLLALGLPLVVAGFGVLPFARGELLRPRLRTMGLLTGAAALDLGYSPLPWMGRVGAALAIGIAGCAWLLLLELTDGEPAGRLVDGLGNLEEEPAEWMDGALIPSLFLCALGLAFGGDAAAPLGIAAAVLLASTSRRSGSLRDALALSTWGAASLATWLATRTVPASSVASVAWTSISLLWVGLLWLPSTTWTWTSRVSLGLTSLWTLALLSARPRYIAFPFSTAETASAFALALAWAAALYAARKQADDPSAISARLGLAAFVFLWGHLELAHSVSSSASSLLLMGYYAVAAVVFVGWGRAKHSATLRRVGLGLGLVAALLAVRGAWNLPGAGTRIAAYLLVSGFLLGIAWWYRQPDDAAAEAAS